MERARPATSGERGGLFWTENEYAYPLTYYWLCGPRRLCGLVGVGCEAQHHFEEPRLFSCL